MSNKMKKIKKARFALPSLVTLGSVFCSFLSMSFTLQAQSMTGADRLQTFIYAGLSILGSIVFDLFDGKVARATHTSTKFGMELDSLADAVSFGVAPAVLIYGFALSQAGIFGLIASFLFISGALIRLARFNIEAPDEGVQTYFKGIPAPGGAACITASVLACISIGFTDFSAFELNTLACLAIAVGLLMVSNIKYKTLKGKKTKGDYVYIAIGLLFFGAMCFFYSLSVAFFLLVCYFVGFGMLNTIYLNLKRSPKRKHRRRHTDDSTTLNTNDIVDNEHSDTNDNASVDKPSDNPSDTATDNEKESNKTTKMEE